jgi:hypothetical protein
MLAAVVILGTAAAAQTAPTSSWEKHSGLPGTGPLVWGSVVFLSDDLCCYQVSQAPLEASPDAPVIETLRDRAFRMGPILWLRIVGDRSLRIIDPYPAKFETLDYHRWRRHSLTAWWDEQRYYVVDVVVHEDRHAYLISEIDGEVSIVHAPPVLSPSGRYAVAFDLSLMNGQSLQLIDLTSRPPKMLEITSPPACPGAKARFLRPKPVWLDDYHVGFEGKPILDEDPSEKQIFRIVDGQVEWEC